MTEILEQTVCTGTAVVHGAAEGEVLSDTTALSFWGGVDPETGEVIDRHHPLHGQQLTDRIVVIPGGRGSCSGSGVLLELLLNGRGPAALVLERADEILTLGVVIAEEVFRHSLPVVVLAPEAFRRARLARRARILGDRVICDDAETRVPAPSTPATAGGPHTPGLALTPDDRAMLDGDRGHAARVAMRILLRMAALQGAERLIDVSRVHVDGCIYTGPGCLRFAQQLLDWGGRVVVPTTLNAISVDYRHWRDQGVDPVIGEPASRLGDAYVRMGAEPTFTCAPYLLDAPPIEGEQIAWAESNAVVHANSVLGARTLKYPDYLDICIALTGRAPLAGCHLPANRRAGLCIRVAPSAETDDAFWPLLGYHVGGIAGDHVPALLGLEEAVPSGDDLKALSAAFATTSSAPMFHMIGVTGEAPTLERATGGETAIETVEVDSAALRASWHALNGAEPVHIDLVSLGNPHFSLTECERLAALCRDRTKDPAVQIIVTCSRAIHERAHAAGLVTMLETFGVRFVTDTCWCMIEEPLIPRDTRIIMTNSAKYAHYGPGLTGRAFRFGSLSACVDAACTGHTDPQPPAWLA